MTTAWERWVRNFPLTMEYRPKVSTAMPERMSMQRAGANVTATADELLTGPMGHLIPNGASEEALREFFHHLYVRQHCTEIDHDIHEHAEEFAAEVLELVKKSRDD